MAEGTFRLYTGKDQQFYFSLKAPNGQVILQSEGYKALAGAENGIESVRAHATGPANYEIREAKNGQFYFVLKAANHQIIGTSELYVTRHNAEEGIESVLRYAPTAPIVRE